MPRLTDPDLRVHASFLAAMGEFQAEGRGGPGDESMIGRDIREYGADWRDPAGFAAYLDALHAARDIDPEADGPVPCTTYWYTDGDTWLGRLAIRHVLNDRLRAWGGHIGYDVRPGARRRGHATAMLRAALPAARALGITSALLTCDADNTGSRKVIEACGGVRAEGRAGGLRYWVPTGER